MAIDEKLASQLRAALGDTKQVREVHMFGGLCFMLNGNMLAACSERGLLVRVGEAAEAKALGKPGAELMVMGGRRMRGYVRVKGTLDGRAVKTWLNLARAFVETLPPKPVGTKRRTRKTTKR